MPRIACLVALVLFASSTATASAANGAATTISFGVSGGNIMPYTVVIDNAGTVTPAALARHRRLGHARVVSLVATARKNGFFALPPTTLCRGVLPDIGADWAKIRVGARVHRVEVHGACVAGFQRTLRALAAAVGLTR